MELLLHTWSFPAASLLLHCGSAICSVTISVQLYAETVPGYILATGHIRSIKHSSPIMLCSESVAACWLSHQYPFIVTLWGSGVGAPDGALR